MPARAPELAPPAAAAGPTWRAAEAPPGRTAGAAVGGAPPDSTAAGAGAPLPIAAAAVPAAAAASWRRGLGVKTLATGNAGVREEGGARGPNGWIEIAAAEVVS